MKCSKCKKKRSRFTCENCYEKHELFLTKKLLLSEQIQEKRAFLEEKVANRLHLLFERQDFLEKHHENQHFLTISSKLEFSLKSQEIRLKTLREKVAEKASIHAKLLAIKSRFLSESCEKSHFLTKSLEKIAFFQKKLDFLQRRKLANFEKILEINTIYPRFSIYKEIKFEKLEEIMPYEEEDIDDFEEIPDVFRITFRKNFGSFSEIYGEIVSFSLNQLAKILFFASKIYDIFMPLVMILEKNAVKIGNFQQDSSFYCVKNVSVRGNYRASQKFLVLLLMNFKFLMKKFGFSQDFRSFGFVNFLDFYEKITKDKSLVNRKENEDFFTFSLIKVKYPLENTGKIEKNEENSLILIKSDEELSEKLQRKTIKTTNSSFEILDSFSDLEP